MKLVITTIPPVERSSHLACFEFLSFDAASKWREFDEGMMEEWVPWQKEFIDLQMEVMKLQGQIEQVEPVSEELKNRIKKLREIQNRHEKEFDLGKMRRTSKARKKVTKQSFRQVMKRKKSSETRQVKKFKP